MFPGCIFSFVVFFSDLGGFGMGENNATNKMERGKTSVTIVRAKMASGLGVLNAK